jgi:hypothetical protein
MKIALLIFFYWVAGMSMALLGSAIFPHFLHGHAEHMVSFLFGMVAGSGGVMVGGYRFMRLRFDN